MRPATGAVMAGFTLLEAIIALVVFSMGALALYGWLGVNLDTLQRVEASQKRIAMVQSGIDVLRRVNPMEEPRGEIQIESYVFAWEAEPVEAIREAVSQVGLAIPFNVGLYDLEVRVLQNGQERERFRVRQLGYEQTGSLSQED